ncbi:endonuclease/exonuclease/phosphatase family protein [Sphingobacterium suaedae]|uniref:Endonuclease/exonuclease/phosphatase family protein n=1 Tax=Sphingobacterium suaedae TaxID=1686402 RepID=A0ABW5KED5_9SPHI
MKKNLWKVGCTLICLFTTLVATTAKGQSATFKIASYNIRYAADQDEKSGNSWQIRKIPLAGLIQRHQFDIVGTQEGNSAQLLELQALLPEFDFIADPYGGKGDLHNTAILYKKDTFLALDSGVFWLSDTPDVPSIGWDASDRRICQWVKFKDKKSGKEFFVFNAHFYWRKQTAREKSGPLVARKIKAIGGNYPIILLGDLNSTSTTKQIAALKRGLKDSYEVTETPRKGIEGTAFPGGVFQGIPKNRIDYIFVTPKVRVMDYEVISDVYDTDRYPSDHLPVSSVILF